MAPAQTIEPGVVPVDTGLETWKNSTRGRVGINRLGDYGRTRRERIDGGKVFTITPGERRLNQNSAHSPEQDVFLNGTFLPIHLIPEEPDTAKLLANPNLVTEDDQRTILRLKGEAFGERIAKITNQAVIDELISMAREPRFKVQVAEYEQLQQYRRVLEAEASIAAEERNPAAAGGKSERAPKPVTMQ